MNAAPPIVVESEACGLNESHKRNIRVTFQCVDALLTDAESVLVNAGSVSLFAKHADDSSPIQRKVVHDYIARLRQAMRRILVELEIPLEPPVCGALWAASTSVLFAGIDLENISPSHLAGYGQLSESAARKVQAIGAELQSRLSKLKSFLASDSDGDFHARLAKLEQTGDEVRLIRELERIITAHGLVEFRGTLAILLNRMETTTFEIGVFGRVSSGKSSLLDYLLKTTALPVGVTPVTAIPTRIIYGEVARARIEFAQAKPRVIALSDLPEYATEQRNPGNEKHVARIEVKLSTPRLREGVVFVDTPGLGSLAAAGAEETIAYLPQCDLGIVLVDASAGLTTDDLQVVQALYRAGANAMVLLSKADLFQSEDRERMMAYVRKNLREQVHVEPSIHAVSIVGTSAVLSDRWWEEALKPQMEKHRELATTARRRKIGGLREAVIDALQMRLRADAANIDGNTTSSHGDRALRDAERAIDLELRQTWELARTIEEITGEIVAALARKLAHAWTDSHETDIARLASEAIREVLAAPTVAFPHRYEELRRQLARTLQQTAGNSTESALADLPCASGLPVIDISSIAAMVVLERPKLLSLLGEGVLAHHLRAEIDKQFGSEIRASLVQYGRGLRGWMDHALRELKTAFDAAADIQRARLNPTGGDGPTDRIALQHDLILLQTWLPQKSAIAPTENRSS